MKTLENGLHTELLPTGLSIVARHVPNRVVTIDVWINTGSAREDDSTNGVSHFLEHMLFKGSRRYGVGELDRAIMDLGGVWNAGTSMDFTHYYVTVGAPFFHQALDVIADMIQHPTLDPVEFEKERSVILEEYLRKQDDPWGWLYDEIYGYAYLSGPYRRTVLGTYESISQLTHDVLVDYYRRTYIAENTNIVVVGDIDPPEVIAAVAQAFSELPAGSSGWPFPHAEISYNSGFRAIVPRDVHKVYLALAYPAPGLDDVDNLVAMDLVSTILGSGRSSRLNQRLHETLKIVDEIGASFHSHRFPSLFSVSACLTPKTLEAAIEESHKCVCSIVGEAPSQAELDKARRILRNTIYFTMETTSGQSDLIGYFLTLMRKPDFYRQYLDLVAEIPVEKVVACAEKYLVSFNPVVIAEVPQNETENASGEAL
jgi:predicted Zn-dependent peptidase